MVPQGEDHSFNLKQVGNLQPVELESFSGILVAGDFAWVMEMWGVALGGGGGCSANSSGAGLVGNGCAWS